MPYSRVVLAPGRRHGRRFQDVKSCFRTARPSYVSCGQAMSAVAQQFRFLLENVKQTKGECTSNKPRANAPPSAFKRASTTPPLSSSCRTCDGSPPALASHQLRTTSSTSSLHPQLPKISGTDPTFWLGLRQQEANARDRRNLVPLLCGKAHKAALR